VKPFKNSQYGGHRNLKFQQPLQWYNQLTGTNSLGQIT